MSNVDPGKRPDNWVEPVYENLLRPPSFFGASPRGVTLCVYAVAVAACFVGATQKSWFLAMVAVGVAAVFHVTTASLTYLEPHWFELLTDWLSSPQSRVDP